MPFERPKKGMAGAMKIIPSAFLPAYTFLARQLSYLASSGGVDYGLDMNILIIMAKTKNRKKRGGRGLATSQGNYAGDREGTTQKARRTNPGTEAKPQQIVAQGLLSCLQYPVP
jgi:hypothetical protein